MFACIPPPPPTTLTFFSLQAPCGEIWAFFYDVGLTYTHCNAGESGGCVGGAAEERLDVVRLGGVLAPAEVRAGRGDALVQAAGQVISPVSHAAHDPREVSLALGGTRPCSHQH